MFFLYLNKDVAHLKFKKNILNNILVFKLKYSAAVTMCVLQAALDVHAASIRLL